MAIRKDSFDIEIETLLSVGQHNHYTEDVIRNVINSENVLNSNHWNVKSLNGPNKGFVSEVPISEPSVWRFKERSVSESSSNADVYHSVEVNGADVGDLPISYVVEGLRSYELPVIGTYVDGRIIPGFKYRVRVLGSNEYLFKGHALKLISIGVGYGKRITMEGDSCNSNNNYFYSDTHPKGYGFELVTVSTGEKFLVYDGEEKTIGEAVIDSIIDLNEIETNIDDETGELQKQVRISFMSSISYGSDSHGLMPLCSNQLVPLNGLLFLTKPKRAKSAIMSAFRDIELKHYGICSFEKGQ